MVDKFEFGFPGDVALVEIQHLIDETGSVLAAAFASCLSHLRMESLWRSTNLLVLLLLYLDIRISTTDDSTL